MRPFKVGKHIFSRLVVAVLMMALIAPPLVTACECLCASGDRLGASGIRTAVTEAFPETGCHAGKYGTGSFVDDFFDGMGRGSFCNTLPVRCCTAGPEEKPVAHAASLTRAQQPTFNELLYQEAGFPAFMPKLPLISTRSCLMFHGNRTPTPPHIASTILLL